MSNLTVSPILTRRALLTGGGALLLAGGSPPEPGDHAPSTLNRGYDQLRDDLLAAWWDPGSNMSDGLAGIRSTDGSGGWNTGRAHVNDRPASIANARGESFWQEAQYLRFLGNDWALRGSTAEGRRARARILSQRRLWRTIYSTEELAGDGSRDDTVNASDDAAWKLQALKAVHLASGSPSDLAILRRATAAMLRRFVDTYTPGHQQTAGALTFSSFGSLYALPDGDPNGQGRASTYETGMMDAALHIARAGGPADAPFRTYAATVYRNFRATLQRPSGIYFQTLQLDPAGRHDRTAFLRPIDAGKPIPREDYDGVTIGGTMGMAVVAAELFRQTGNDAYRRDVAHIVAGITAGYVQNGCILCDRDPWTAGVWGYDFAARALLLPGVDPDGRLAAALHATALRILSTRTPIDAGGGRRGWGYSAEWSGNTERSVGETSSGRNDGVATWAENARRANGGRGGGQASPDQIMTASSSGIMVQAAVRLAMPR